MDELLKNGMKESVANQVVTDAIVREAVEEGDEDILSESIGRITKFANLIMQKLEEQGENDLGNS